MCGVPLGILVLFRPPPSHSCLTHHIFITPTASGRTTLVHAPHFTLTAFMAVAVRVVLWRRRRPFW